MSLARGRQLAAALQSLGVNVQSQVARLQEAEQQAAGLDKSADEATWKSAYFAVRTTVRELALSNPLLDFDSIVFVKRAPTMFPHLSDQCYGWWARPGGGICVLEKFKSPDAQVRSLTSAWPAGNFHGLDVSPDATTARVCLQPLLSACGECAQQARQE